MKSLYKYNNGNASVEIFDNGTRVIEFKGELKLQQALNIDIRVSTACSFGLNPETGKSFCSFCHESATTNGVECDYAELKSKLNNLPAGIELAIGGNKITSGLMEFCAWASEKGYVVNLTVNQGHILKYQHKLDELIEKKHIRGLGISYRSGLEDNVPERFKKYENTVLHVIAGIDKFEDVYNNTSFEKVLVLGEKDFGFNKGNVNIKSQSHKEWYWWIAKLFGRFKVVSFDNLALEQLNVERFFTKPNWEVFNQGENSFYIDAVNKVFAPSSRSAEKENWDCHTVSSYFKKLNK